MTTESRSLGSQRSRWARFANGFTTRTYTTPEDTTDAGGDVTLQGLADGLAERGLKVDYRTM